MLTGGKQGAVFTLPRHPAPRIFQEDEIHRIRELMINTGLRNRYQDSDGGMEVRVNNWVDETVLVGGKYLVEAMKDDVSVVMRERALSGYSMDVSCYLFFFEIHD